MPMTAYLRKKDGDHNIGKSAFTMPTAVYLALFTASPTDAGTQTSEVVGSPYVRIELTSKMGAFDSFTGIAVNSANVDFGVPAANWGIVTYAGVMDAITTGNMLYYEALPVPRVVTSGSRRVIFTAGQIQIRHV